MRGARLAAIALLAAAPAAAQLQPVGDTAPPTRVFVRTPGPRRPFEMLTRALGEEHVVLFAGDSALALPRDSTLPRGVIVIGGDATVASRVQGSILVVGGDLFIHPGAEVEGDASAIGGCVYPSTLARVRGEQQCFRDGSYLASRAAGDVTLDYVPLATTPVELLSFPLAYGFRIPEYTRVDGLALPWGPRIALDSARIDVEPIVTYRSDLGELDPSLSVRAGLGRHLWADIVAERGTYSNDRWIHSDIINSLAVLTRGSDTRNYYRAERATARLGYRAEWASAEGVLWAGAQTERARSVRAGGPWSLFDRTDSLDGMFRLNPAIDRGTISSALAGGSVSGAWQDVRYSVGTIVERALDAPGARRFTQATSDVAVSFPTFGMQSFSVEAHLVGTFGDAAPAQRFAYLGGSGTLPTLDLLAMGGDRLVYVDSRYQIPIERWRVPFVGAPVVTLRHAIGSAGAGKLPTFVQNLALQLALYPLRVQLALDPATRDTNLSLGLSMAR